MLKIEELLQEQSRQGVSATVPGTLTLSVFAEDDLIFWRSDEGDGSDESVCIQFCAPLDSTAYLKG